MLWERRAEALVALGRPTEAIAALESACGHQREAVERDPRSIDYKAQLFRHHYYLVALHCVLGRTGEAQKSLEAAEPLWPTNPGSLFTYVRDLVHGWPKATLADGETTEAASAATELYATLVLTTLERSLTAGFRDFSLLINDPNFQFHRERADFQRLLVRMMDLAFPANPLVR